MVVKIYFMGKEYNSIEEAARKAGYYKSFPGPGAARIVAVRYNKD